MASLRGGRAWCAAKCANRRLACDLLNEAREESNTVKAEKKSVGSTEDEPKPGLVEEMDRHISVSSAVFAITNRRHSGALHRITRIHTLGPEGTNCEAAAKSWLMARGGAGEVVLHATLEEAVPAVVEDPAAALLGCVVYPDLHKLVFGNLHSLVLADCFVVPTHRMVLAARPDAPSPSVVATHPAPESLIPTEIAERRFVSSNVVAALSCARGEVDGCITTEVAAKRLKLQILRDFGAIEMGFTIHVPLRKEGTR